MAQPSVWQVSTRADICPAAESPKLLLCTEVPPLQIVRGVGGPKNLPELDMSMRPITYRVLGTPLVSSRE